MKKIFIVNAHWNNRGDEAALRAIVDRLLSEIDDIDITIMFKDNNEIKQYPFPENVHYMCAKFLPNYIQVLLAEISNGKLGCNKKMKEIVGIIKKSDMIIYSPGGAVISDRFWWKKQLEYLFPIALAERNNIPVCFAAPSIGPFYKKRIYRKHVLKNVDIICVREEISKAYLEKEIDKCNYNVTIDSTFLDKPDFDINEKEYKEDAELNSFISNHKKVIGMTLTDFKWHVEYNKDDQLRKRIYETFRAFIAYLNDQKVGVVLIPQLFGNQNDINYLKKFNSSNVIILNENYDTYFQQYLISKLYMVIGMRYHSNIFAAKMCTPFIPIVYEEKMSGFLEQEGYNSLAVALYELSENKLIEKYNYVEINRDRIIKTLKVKNLSWHNKAEITIHKILKGIQKGGK